MKNKVIKDLDRLAEKIAECKKQNKTVIFGNGCFDILHVGHIRYLKGAKELGDVLVVAVNSDSSLKTIKKDTKLIIPEDERLEILSAIECVDFVTVFSEPNVKNLLLRLKPHVQAKGTDYTKETVPERDTVLSYGGRVEIVGDPKTHSSSKIKQLLN